MLLVFLLSISAVSPVAAEDLSLSEAWHRLLNISDKLAAETANLERAGLHQKAAKSLYLPQVEMNAQYLHLGEDVDLTPEMIFDNMEGGDVAAQLIGAIGHGYYTPAQLNSKLTTHLVDQNNLLSSVSAVWPIYAGGRIDAAQDIAAGQYREADAQRTMIERQQFQDLVQRYFGVVLAEQMVQTLLTVEQGLMHHLHNAELLEQQGQISKVERLQAAAATDKARVDRKKAERQLEIARTALGKMLKTTDEVIPVDALFINAELPELNDFIEKTYQNYPGLGVLKAKKDQATGLVAVEKGKYLPEVAVMGNYMVSEKNSLSTELAPDWFVGVGVNFTLFDRDGRAEKLASARTSIRQVDSLIAQAVKDLSILTEENYRQAQQSYEEYQGLASSLELGKESLELRNKSFSQGLSTSLDVVDAEMFLAGVTIQRSVASYNYVKYLANLLVLSGEVDSFVEYQQQAVAIQK